MEALESLQTKERSSGREPAMSITVGSIIAHTTRVTMSTVIAIDCQCRTVNRTVVTVAQGTGENSQVTSSPMRMCMTDVLTQLAMPALIIVSLELEAE